MNSVVAYLQGGLGNQAFIYAAARALSLRTGASLLLDGGYFLDDKTYHRAFSLAPFGMELTSASPSFSTRLLRRFRYALLRDHVSHVGNYCCDKRPFRWRPLPGNWQGTLTLDGYFQSEKYFFDARKQIFVDFTLQDASWLESDSLAQKIRSSANSIFMHVRTYKDIPGKEDGSRALKNIQYYYNALTYLKGMLGRASVFVFSDEIEWARANVVKEIPGFKFIYADAHSTQIRDFMLMRLCQHGITANSSYSWWASWLGEQEHGGIRIRLDKRVMNDDFWPERWIPISRKA